MPSPPAAICSATAESTASSVGTTTTGFSTSNRSPVADRRGHSCTRRSPPRSCSSIGLALTWLNNQEIRREDVQPRRPVRADCGRTGGARLPDADDPQRSARRTAEHHALLCRRLCRHRDGSRISPGPLDESRAAGEGTLRAILTLPIFATPIGIGYLARTIFYEEGGPAEAFLGVFGVAPPWLSNPEWARVATIIIDVWQWTPFVFIIALAGFQGLPQDVIEASEVDGANAWQVLRFVTLPLMAPILWLILLLRTIDGFKVFDIPSV